MLTSPFYFIPSAPKPSSLLSPLSLYLFISHSQALAPPTSPSQVSREKILQESRDRAGYHEQVHLHHHRFCRPCDWNIWHR
ncbi:hypothetical protein MRB53_027890 [Persea americana]|uniref:Uncharacterized protein n=1 Tax=Persea americana TaxID=3435 RepID=A0ACC2KE28_PERAE|nr:hypothetical protein MRB53_027890 [Persea americana]